MISCTPTDSPPEYKLLGELKDNRERLIKKAESGWIPGEDIWLKITRYDTLGNIIEVYGAKPYGSKYKYTYKYDGQSRLIEECNYSYRSKDNDHISFENYGPKYEYELKDTLVDFSVTDNDLDFKTVYSYDDKNKITRESHYYMQLDTMTNEIRQIFIRDTLYKSVNADSLRTTN